jgi:alkylation response protein AidB-like acyl-CoA dehydrogenase
LLQGRKGPVLNAQAASYALTVAKSAHISGSEEINLWVVPLEPRQGLKLIRTGPEWGFSAAGPAEMIFENITLLDQALLGRPGQGRQQLKELEQNAWVATAALAVGIGQAILEEARSFTAGQTQSGKPLAASQAIQWKLADLATDLEAAELLTLRAAWHMDQVKPFEKEAAMAKQYALNMVLKASRDGIQILAGRGYLRKSPMARLIQDAEGCQLFNIYDETLTSIIAKNL